MLDDFYEFEKNFDIEIGKYDFFFEIFEKVDRFVFLVINKVLSSIW